MKKTSAIVMVLSVAFLTITMSLNNVKAQEGLVGYWKFDEGSGTIAIDSSGNGNDGTLYNGVSWVDGIFGKAMSFDGFDDYVRVEASSSLDVTSEVTVETWVCPEAYVDSTGQASSMISRAHLSGGHVYMLSIYPENNKASFSVNPIPWEHPSNVDLPLSKWTHLAMTYDGANVTLYVNGEFDAWYALSGPIEITSNWLAFGCIPCGPYGGEGTYAYFNGTIDEVRIYNRALSEQEVQDDMESARYWQRYPGNPVLDAGPPGAWDAEGPRDPFVMKDGEVYKMWYNSEYSVGGHDYIGFANSTDGKNWTKYAGNPVLSPGTGWEWGRIYLPSVLKENGVYKMWYAGREGLGSGKARIGFANSTDGLNWMKYEGNPVFDVGIAGQWDDYLTSQPSVIKHEGIYKMWYVGRRSSGANRIGYATSIDGFNWTRWPDNPVLDIGSSGEFDSNLVAAPTVFYENGLYHMWYQGDAGGIGSIGYAFSVDGVNWTKWNDNPVFERETTNSWESSFVTVGHVMRDGWLLKMWYWGRGSGTIARIGYAEAICSDIAANGITTSKSSCLPMPTVGQGCPVELAMEIENQGNHAEMFNATIYANATLIGSLENVITTRNVTTVPFTWNTTGFAKGNYTITVEIQQLPYETDSHDNRLTADWLVVTIPGDVDGDFDVDIIDVVKITSIYGSKQGDPQFNPNSDLDDDGTITILDVVICTSHYGEKYP